MRRDSIFYQFFQQTPTLIFDLLPEAPPNASSYRFDSVAVKEPRFEIDGVFLPPDTEPGIVYFCEIQFQRDELLYERLFGELFLYFYRNRRRFTDWQAVVIYPTRSVEQTDTHPYRSQLNSNQMHRIYLDELGDIEQLPLGVALMALTIVKEAQVPEVARMLLIRSQAETEETRRGIIEMMTTIVVYKFTNLSRQEAEAMLGITNLQETRFYQEAKEEGLAEGRAEGRTEGRAEGRTEGRAEGRTEGRAEEGRSLTLRLLTRRFGELPQPLTTQITTLSLPQLETLAEALLDFQSLADLETWLTDNAG